MLYYFDSETGFYYLKSRYYDPEVGRFINADGYASTGQGVIGNNMFAYCNNNPVNMTDSNGKDPTPAWAIRINSGAATPTDYKTALSVNPNSWAGFASIAVNNAIEKAKKYQASYSYSAKNKDGSYSLYDNQRKNPDSSFHEQVLTGSVSGPSFSLEDGNVSLGSVSGTIMTGGWEFEHVDISALDVLHAEAGIGLEDGQFNASAMASAWSPSITIKKWDVKITISGHIGAVGGEFKIGSGNLDIKGAGLLGFGISVNW